ncbi:MAG: polymerase [Pseudobdellovibrio sp.]|jgi:DNA polymerase-1|nr:polymerase [Pseudobdellovibrio sp.]
MKKEIYIVDVSSMFFRAFYAIRPLTSTKGVPVNAVYGFISMIVKLFKDKKPDHVVFCYDRKEPSFRKNLYTEYKANRSDMPDDLQVQMPYLKQVAGLFGICDMELDTFEADDLIGTVACVSKKQGYDVYIVSGDKDFCQLVDSQVFVYDTMKEVIFDAAMVKEKHGVTPEQFIDYLAITGDSSDNIPGVAGIGPKGAQKLIEQFGTLEKIYENIDQISSASIKEKLLNSKSNAFLSKKLVTIVCDAPITHNLDDFKVKPFKTDELRAFLQELNFKTFEKNLLGEGKSGFDTQAPAAGRAIVSSVTGQVFKVQEEEKHEAVAPVNNVQLKEWNAEEVQKRLTAQEAFFAYIHSSKIGFGFGEELYLTDLSNCKLNLNNLTWSGFDLKRVWMELGIQPESAKIKNDLLLTTYVLRAADSSDYEKLGEHFLQQQMDLKAITEENEKMKRLYALFLQLSPVVNEEMEKKDLNVIYQKLEKPLIPVLFEMEKKGIKLDLQFLKKFSKELQVQLEEQEKKIYELAGGEKFNIGSPKQLGVVLFEKLGLEVIKKTKTGYSTDNDVLEKLQHPIAKEIIEYREIAKLKSTYVDALPEMADQKGRVHSHLNQALTATGRLSSTNPNLQNIPIRTERGQKVRKAFIADEGKKLLSVDYSQIELRVLAHISDDAGLIRAFKDNLDIHTATASEVFGVSLKDVTKEQRRIAKAVNFGIAYGQGTYGLAEALGISRKESAEIIEKYFLKFGGIRDYIKNTIEKAHEQKYVETLFGRRRYIPELDNKNVMIKKFGERAAINAPIQGTASDLVKMAMIELAPGLKVDMLLQVHDELIFEGTEAALKEQVPWIVDTMENVAKLKVPLKVNFSIGDNWDEAH